MQYVHPDWFNKCAYVRLCKCSFEVNLNPCAAEFRRKLFTSEKILKNISVVGRWQVEEEKLYLTYAYPLWLKNVMCLLSSLKRRVMGHIFWGACWNWLASNYMHFVITIADTGLLVPRWIPATTVLTVMLRKEREVRQPWSMIVLWLAK